MRSLPKDLLASFRNPEFWALSGWLDIVVKYRQSRLGLVWLLAPAVVYVFGLGGFFSAMYGADLTTFAAHVAIGWILFRAVSTVIVESTTVFVASAPFIMDGHVRLTDFVLRVVAKSLFYMATSLPVVIVAMAIFPTVHGEGIAMALLTLPVVVANALWIGLLFALIGARFPDLSQFIGNIFIFAFLLTPIIWYAETMPAGSLRGSLMRANPFFHLVELVRAPILGTPIESFTFYYLGVMTVLGWVLAVLAYRRFARFVPIWV